MSAYEHIPRYNILSFGDSNTFGTNPSGGRWGRYTRWPGRLQQLLGEDYYVVEEGFSGRTTVFNDPIVPLRARRAALRAHLPQAARPGDHHAGHQRHEASLLRPAGDHRARRRRAGEDGQEL